MVKLIDSRGKKSITLSLVVVSWFVVVVKFVFAGIKCHYSTVL